MPNFNISQNAAEWPRFHYSNSAVQEIRSFHPNTINTFLANQEDNVFAKSQVRGWSMLKCTIWSFSDSQKRKQLSCWLEINKFPCSIWDKSHPFFFLIALRPIRQWAGIEHRFAASLLSVWRSLYHWGLFSPSWSAPYLARAGSWARWLLMARGARWALLDTWIPIVSLPLDEHLPLHLPPCLVCPVAQLVFGISRYLQCPAW